MSSKSNQIVSLFCLRQLDFNSFSHLAKIQLRFFIWLDVGALLLPQGLRPLHDLALCKCIYELASQHFFSLFSIQCSIICVGVM